MSLIATIASRIGGLVMLVRIVGLAAVCSLVAGCADVDGLTFAPFSDPNISSGPSSGSAPPATADPVTTAPDQVQGASQFCRGAANSYGAQQAALGESAAELDRFASAEYVQCMRSSPYWLSD